MATRCAGGAASRLVTIIALPTPSGQHLGAQAVEVRRACAEREESSGSARSGRPVSAVTPVAANRASNARTRSASACVAGGAPSLVAQRSAGTSRSTKALARSRARPDRAGLPSVLVIALEPDQAALEAADRARVGGIDLALDVGKWHTPTRGAVFHRLRQGAPPRARTPNAARSANGRGPASGERGGGDGSMALRVHRAIDRGVDPARTDPVTAKRERQTSALPSASAPSDPRIRAAGERRRRRTSTRTACGLVCERLARSTRRTRRDRLGEHRHQRASRRVARAASSRRTAARHRAPPRTRRPTRIDRHARRSVSASGAARALRYAGADAAARA